MFFYTSVGIQDNNENSKGGVLYTTGPNVRWLADWIQHACEYTSHFLHPLCSAIRFEDAGLRVRTIPPPLFVKPEILFALVSLKERAMKNASDCFAVPTVQIVGHALWIGFLQKWACMFPLYKAEAPRIQPSFMMAKLKYLIFIEKKKVLKMKLSPLAV